MPVYESHFEEAALDWLIELGYQKICGYDIALGSILGTLGFLRITIWPAFSSEGGFFSSRSRRLILAVRFQPTERWR